MSYSADPMVDIKWGKATVEELKSKGFQIDVNYILDQIQFHFCSLKLIQEWDTRRVMKNCRMQRRSWNKFFQPHLKIRVPM